MSPLAPSFYPPRETVESVVGENEKFSQYFLLWIHVTKYNHSPFRLRTGSALEEDLNLELSLSSVDREFGKDEDALNSSSLSSAAPGKNINRYFFKFVRNYFVIERYMFLHQDTWECRRCLSRFQALAKPPTTHWVDSLILSVQLHHQAIRCTPRLHLDCPSPSTCLTYVFIYA